MEKVSTAAELVLPTTIACRENSNLNQSSFNSLGKSQPSPNHVSNLLALHEHIKKLEEKNEKIIGKNWQ